ncbi:MAG: type II toxin-antitoxin system MqsA family antitoxin [Lachnospiraceae bacterium]|nr:type II toxin-antitoxin system MqsA family antitoxin [Lachnospiraceae bacterium]
MTCFYCKGNVEESTTTYMTDYQNCYIIIKNVPCEKCTQCGEEYISGDVLEKIENIIRQLKGMLPEIAVIDFRQAA